jgi:AcrR family transcriptional regulator
VATTNLKPAGARFKAEDRREQILAAATDLFARQGFQGTTTREIAHRARVNEAIIFRHFPSKEDLYWAVIDHKCEQGGTPEIVAEYTSKGLPLAEVFAGIAGALMRLRQRDPGLLRLMLFCALEQHELSRRLFRTHMADFYNSLAQYIRKEIRAGRLRDVDPLMAARGFWGMISYHFMVQELFVAKPSAGSNVEEEIRVLVDVWLRGMMRQSEQ